jgi:hypothetical protein
MRRCAGTSQIAARYARAHGNGLTRGSDQDLEIAMSEKNGDEKNKNACVRDLCADVMNESALGTGQGVEQTRK